MFTTVSSLSSVLSTARRPKLCPDRFDIRGAVLALSIELETLHIDALDSGDQLFDLSFVRIVIRESFGGEADQPFINIDVDRCVRRRREMVQAGRLYSRVLSLRRPCRRYDKQHNHQRRCSIDLEE